MKLPWKAVTVALGLALAGGAAWAQEQPSLGDVARQKPQKKAAKVVDEENFQPTAKSEAPAPNALAAEKPAAKPSDSAKAEAKGNGEAAASDSVKALQKELADLKGQRGSYETQVATLKSRHDVDTDPDTRGSLMAALEACKERIAEIDVKIAAIQAKLDEAGPAKDEGEEAGSEASKPAESGAPAKPEEKPTPQ